MDAAGVMAGRSSPGRNLVLGAVCGYAFAELRPFVVSLKRTSFNGDLCLLYTNLSEETLAALREHGVKLVHFDYRGQGALNSWSRFWPQIRPLLALPVGNVLRRAVLDRILNLAFVRYLHAQDFLQQNQGKYANVLLTDVRDVVFQDDPFRDPLPSDIVAFLETADMRFGVEPVNTNWVRENYGEPMVIKLSGKRTSCCGTVMGTSEGMEAYLAAFTGQMLILPSVAHGADTSVHNVLVYEVLRERVSVVENLAGAVGTIGADTSNQLSLDTKGLVVNERGVLVPVLHQYDRHPALASNLVQALTGQA
jgi:hypothetical protein